MKDETVKQVYPGIFQLRIPIPNNRLNHTLSYLLVGSDGHILIDTGIYSEQGLESFKEQINQIGIQADSIDTILITHNHPDLIVSDYFWQNNKNVCKVRSSNYLLFKYWR